MTSNSEADALRLPRLLIADRRCQKPPWYHPDKRRIGFPNGVIRGVQEIEGLPERDEAIHAELDAMDERIVEQSAENFSDLLAKLRFLTHQARGHEWDDCLEKLYASIEEGLCNQAGDRDQMSRIEDELLKIKGVRECLASVSRHAPDASRVTERVNDRIDNADWSGRDLWAAVVHAIHELQHAVHCHAVQDVCRGADRGALTFEMATAPRRGFLGDPPRTVRARSRRGAANTLAQ